MNRFKELRLQNGYKTQGDLAKVLFVNQTAVSQWERGVTLPSSQMLIKLSNLYGESVEYILGQEKPQKEPIPEDGDGLSEEQRELLRLFKSAPAALRSAALAVLRAAEAQDTTPDAAESGEETPHSQNRKHQD